MKLNNKGFAFSTMLYGSITLIIVVLMLVLSNLKQNSDESYYYSSVVEDTLNRCVSEEIALENCYTSGSTNCDTTSYYACLGINNNVVVSGTRIADFFQDKVSTSAGLYNDTETGGLIFKGDTANNYIQYSGDLWRIISIDSGGNAKIAYTRYSNVLKWDADGTNEWRGSSLNNELNNTFYQSLRNTSYLYQKNWNTGRIYSTAQTLADLLEQESKVIYSDGYVGLVNASDYIKASLNEACKDNVLASDQCTSWLSVHGSWLINSSYTESSEVEAYRFDSNRLVKENVGFSYNVVPVVYIKGTVEITGGEGTLSNPYVLER